MKRVLIISLDSPDAPLPQCYLRHITNHHDHHLNKQTKTGNLNELQWRKQKNRIHLNMNWDHAGCKKKKRVEMLKLLQPLKIFLLPVCPKSMLLVFVWNQKAGDAEWSETGLLNSTVLDLCFDYCYTRTSERTWTKLLSFTNTGDSFYT